MCYYVTNLNAKEKYLQLAHKQSITQPKTSVNHNSNRSIIHRKDPKCTKKKQIHNNLDLMTHKNESILNETKGTSASKFCQETQHTNMGDLRSWDIVIVCTTNIY